MNHRTSMLLFALFAVALTGGGCESSETPTVRVMPDQRLKPASLVPDDFGVAPKIVEVNVPVPSPQLRPIGGGNESPVMKTSAAAVAAAKAGATTQPASDGTMAGKSSPIKSAALKSTSGGASGTMRPACGTCEGHLTLARLTTPRNEPASGPASRQGVALPGGREPLQDFGPHGQFARDLPRALCGVDSRSLGRRAWSLSLA